METKLVNSNKVSFLVNNVAAFFHLRRSYTCSKVHILRSLRT